MKTAILAVFGGICLFGPAALAASAHNSELIPSGATLQGTTMTHAQGPWVHGGAQGAQDSPNSLPAGWAAPIGGMDAPATYVHGPWINAGAQGAEDSPNSMPDGQQSPMHGIHRVYRDALIPPATAGATAQP